MPLNSRKVKKELGNYTVEEFSKELIQPLLRHDESEVEQLKFLMMEQESSPLR